jgi:hypothetical protein
VTTSQVGEMPHGGADTGSPVQDSDGTGVLVGAGAGVLAVAALGGGVWAVRRRSAES